MTTIIFTLIAQRPKDLGTIGGSGGLGPFSELIFKISGITDVSLFTAKFNAGFSSIVGLLTLIAALYFIFQFVAGGLQWLSSGGDKAGLQAAQQKITNSFVGLIIIVSAIAVISLVSTFLGFDLLNPAVFIDSIRFK